MARHLPPLGPEIGTLNAALASRAAQAPDALAFAEGGESLTYGQLQADAEALAGGLFYLGVRSGDRVALLLPAGLGFVRAFFAVQRLGAAPCAFDPSAPPEASARRIERIRPRLVINSETLERAPRAASTPPSFEDEKDVAFLQPTSGTSGEPRAAMVLQRNVIASLRSAREGLGLGPEDVFVSWVPPWHDLGLMRFVLGPVYFGAPCHLVEPAIRTLPLWLQAASEVRATVIGAPDFAYRLAARLVDPAGIDLASLRYATNGGEPVRRSTILGFEERFGAPGAVRPGYGLAEATLGVTCLRPGEPLRVDERGNVSCGRPLPGVEVRIDEKEGEILVRGPAVFAGYFDAPEATAEALRGGWLHTGDAGALDEDGNLYVLGRLRALLKRGGAPLAPREIEEAVADVPGLRVAAAVGLPAPGATEEIVLAVEADPAADIPELAASAASAVERALGFAPDRIVVLAPRTLPRTSNGKVRHRVLRDALASGELENLFNRR